MSLRPHIVAHWVIYFVALLLLLCIGSIMYLVFSGNGAARWSWSVRLISSAHAETRDTQEGALGNIWSQGFEDVVNEYRAAGIPYVSLIKRVPLTLLDGKKDSVTCQVLYSGEPGARIYSIYAYLGDTIGIGPQGYQIMQHLARGLIEVHSRSEIYSPDYELVLDDPQLTVIRACHSIFTSQPASFGLEKLLPELSSAAVKR